MPTLATAIFCFAVSVLSIAFVMYRRVRLVEATIAPRPETVQSQSQWLVFAAIAAGSTIIALALLEQGL